MSSDTLAIIPARGGSKRILQKNIQEVAGKPLIAHTIQDAEKAENIDKVIISTDCTDIAQVAREYGGEVPFIRPEELATDSSAATDVVTHALEWANEQLWTFDYICFLQVTTPLRKPQDIDGTLQRLYKTGAESCVSISEYVSPPQWAMTINEDGILTEYFDDGMLWDNELTRSQDIPKLYHPNGAVFTATTDAWRKYESFYTTETTGYKMPVLRSFDIDEPWELELVRALME